MDLKFIESIKHMLKSTRSNSKHPENKDNLTNETQEEAEKIAEDESTNSSEEPTDEPAIKTDLDSEADEDAEPEDIIDETEAPEDESAAEVETARAEAASQTTANQTETISPQNETNKRTQSPLFTPEQEKALAQAHKFIVNDGGLQLIEDEKLRWWIGFYIDSLHKIINGLAADMEEIERQKAEAEVKRLKKQYGLSEEQIIAAAKYAEAKNMDIDKAITALFQPHKTANTKKRKRKSQPKTTKRRKKATPTATIEARFRNALNLRRLQ